MERRLKDFLESRDKSFVMHEVQEGVREILFGPRRTIIASVYAVEPSENEDVSFEIVADETLNVLTACGALSLFLAGSPESLPSPLPDKLVRPLETIGRYVGKIVGPRVKLQAVLTQDPHDKESPSGSVGHAITHLARAVVGCTDNSGVGWSTLDLLTRSIKSEVLGAGGQKLADLLADTEAVHDKIAAGMAPSEEDLARFDARAAELETDRAAEKSAAVEDFHLDDNELVSVRRMADAAGHRIAAVHSRSPRAMMHAAGLMAAMLERMPESSSPEVRAAAGAFSKAVFGPDGLQQEIKFVGESGGASA